MVHMDTTQHVRREFDHRNWIKIPGGSKRWIIVHRDSSNPFAQSLNKVRLANDGWRTSIQNRLYNSYHQAPYYQPHADELINIINTDWSSLADLNLALIKHICSQLAIITPARLLSEFEADFGKRSERLINICRRVRADIYLSGQGSRAYLDEDLFHKAGIRVEYQDYTPIRYPQIHGEFIPNLSIVDLLFNTGPAAREYLSGDKVDT